MYEKGREQLEDVVFKLSRPRLAGKDLTYDIKVIEGKVPQKGGVCSVFIDIIGLPLTPLSFAGVARRTAFRTVMWDTAATSAAATSAMASYSTNVTINENVSSPPPAPAVTNSQAEAVARLKELKSLLQQGLITEAQYSRVAKASQPDRGIGRLPIGRKRVRKGKRPESCRPCKNDDDGER